MRVTALCTNMRILKFQSQLTIAFFAAVNHLNGPLRKQNFTLTGSKGHGLWFLIGGFRSVLWVFFVSRFVACDGNYDWRQRKTQLWRRLLNFRVRMFVKRAVRWALEYSAKWMKCSKKQLSLKENRFIYKELKSLYINFAIKVITRHAILFVCL